MLSKPQPAAVSKQQRGPQTMSGSGQEGSGSWWGWGDALLQTVKKQSETIISIYKEDLSEFTRTIKEDTLNVVKDVIQEKDENGSSSSSSNTSSSSSPTDPSGRQKRTPLKTSTSSTNKLSTTGQQTGQHRRLDSGITNFLNFMDNLKDEDEEEVLAKTRREKSVKKLQKDPNTYIKEPDDIDDFKAWQADFNLESHTVEISQLLSANPKLRALHNELLPSLTYTVFWERYYYRLEKVLKDEERREKILMRAELDSKLDDWGGWEDDDDADNTLPAEQERSLAAETQEAEETATVSAEDDKNESVVRRRQSDVDRDDYGKEEEEEEEEAKEEIGGQDGNNAPNAAGLEGGHDSLMRQGEIHASSLPSAALEATSSSLSEDELATEQPSAKSDLLANMQLRPEEAITPTTDRATSALPTEEQNMFGNEEQTNQVAAQNDDQDSEEDELEKEFEKQQQQQQQQQQVNDTPQEDAEEDWGAWE